MSDEEAAPEGAEEAADAKPEGAIGQTASPSENDETPLSDAAVATGEAMTATETSKVDTSPGEPSGTEISYDQFRSRSRRSFLTGAVGVVAAAAGIRWLDVRPDDDRISKPLRSVLELNESIWSRRTAKMAPEFSVDEATPIQVNGRIGMRLDMDVNDWSLEVRGPDGQTLDELVVADFEAMEQRDLVIEHKCIEGWSSIVHWGGVRFSGFAQPYLDEIGSVDYVHLTTPDGDYYVGWDFDSIMHPQTLLALREHGEPLDQDHGAPLRLATPNKYGIKCLKRIGLIEFTNERPPDYWGERGYDWYAGL